MGAFLVGVVGIELIQDSYDAAIKQKGICHIDKVKLWVDINKW